MKTFSNIIIENNIEKQKISYEKHRRLQYNTKKFNHEIFFKSYYRKKIKKISYENIGDLNTKYI